MFNIRRMSHSLIHSTLSIIGLWALLLSPTRATATTLENLQTEYNRERSAHVRYLAFAERATADGYGGVASLFRAAARAEQIHAINIRNAMIDMGSSPRELPSSRPMRTTRENPFSSSQDESCQRINYEEYIRQAKLDGNKRLIEILTAALAGEREQTALFIDAMSTLDCMRGLKEASYLVCPACGFITREATLSRCPVCPMQKEGFEVVV